LKEVGLVEKMFVISVVKMFSNYLHNLVLTENVILAHAYNAYWYIKAWSGIILLLRT
jgi:hypothetical protein